MKTDRLFQIVYILLEKQWITAKELSERLEVSKRTIYRDIDVLTLSGIPIYTTKGKGGGIGLLDHYVLSKSILNDHEKSQVLVALDTLKATGFDQVNHVMTKLRSIFNQHEDSWIDIDFSNWTTQAKGQEQFVMLKEGLSIQQSLVFDYINANGDKSRREVYPLKLIFKKRDWYLFAYCKKKTENRLFKVRRIYDLSIGSEDFNRSDYLSKEDKVIREKESLIELDLLIDKSLKHRVYDEFDIGAIAINESGDYNVRIEMADNDWLYHYLLSFENHMTIVKPTALNAKLRAILEKTLKNYL